MTDGKIRYVVCRLTDGSYSLEPPASQPKDSIVFASTTLYQAEAEIERLREAAIAQRALARQAALEKQRGLF